MAYKALYRTYRPSCFEEVAGQQHIVKTLQNAIFRKKIAHAYLFCGPRGTGKTSIAKIFAKAINCESLEKKPCQQCDNCLAVQNGTHPDIIEIDAASNNGVLEVRELIEKVKYAPLKGQYKIYIIDEVHMMSAGAFNALLKTIEEPPEHVIFIFATTEPQKVLPTIISRCQRYDFTKVDTPDMTKRIEEVLEKEHIEYELEAIRLICSLADGGMRDALSILDQVIAYAQDTVKVNHVNAIYGIVSVAEKIELINFVKEKDAFNTMNRVAEMIDKGIDIKRLTLDLVDILKESIIMDYAKDEKLLSVLSKSEVAVVIQNKTSRERLKMIDYLMETYDKYRNASNIGSYFEVCLLKMMDTEIEVEQVHVSRETFEPKKISKKEVKPVIQRFEPEEETVETSNETTVVQGNQSSVPLAEELLLQLLVGANKSAKNSDIASLVELPQYYIEPTWAKQANLLRNCKIVASSQQYIIVGVDNQAIANEINDLDKAGSFIAFMHLLLGKKKKVFAITQENEQNIVKEFVRRSKENTLPELIHFEFEENTEVVHKLSNIEVVENLFGKENVIVTED